MATIKGECACGDIKVEVPKPTGSEFCHCTDCRKSGGGPAAVTLTVKVEDLVLSGVKPKVYSKVGGSGSKMERWFCDHCGCPILSKTGHEGYNHLVWVRAGLFAPGDIPAPTMHMFAKNFESWEKPVDGAKAYEVYPDDE